MAKEIIIKGPALSSRIKQGVFSNFFGAETPNGSLDLSFAYNNNLERGELYFL